MDPFGDEPDWALDSEDDDGDENEDGDDVEDGGGRRPGGYGAEHVLFLLDCRPSMFVPYVPCLADDDDPGGDGDDGDDDGNGSGEGRTVLVSPADVAVEAVHRFLRSKVRDVAETRTGKRDAAGVVLYGCDPRRGMRTRGGARDGGADDDDGNDDDDDENGEELPTTHELIELGAPGIEQALALQECRRPSASDPPHRQRRDLRREFAVPSSEEGGGSEEEEGDDARALVQGLVAATKIFVNSKLVKTPGPSSKQPPDSKAVWIFTNQDDPCRTDETQRARLDMLKRDCREADINIHVMPLPKFSRDDGEMSEFDQSLFYNDLTAPFNRVEDADGLSDSNGTVDVEAILLNFDMGARKRRKQGTLPLLLPGWKDRRDHPGIMLDLYGSVQLRKKPMKYAVHQENNKMTTRRTKCINKDTGDEVDREDIHQFVDFCGRVSVHPADLAKMKKASNSLDKAGLVLHGFRPSKLLPTANLVSKNVLVYANDVRVQGSGKALFNLKQSMMKKNVFAVGELLLRATATSRMVAMVPTKDESTGFLLIHLPYKEDTREVSHKDIGFADQNSVNAAKRLILKSTLQCDDFAATLPENPWLRHFFGYLESVSLGRPLGEVEDDAKMDVERMLETAGEEIASFSLSLPEEEQPVKKERKRKAPTSSKPEFLKESISDEWIDRYKNDEVVDCTANKLKDFLKSQGERIAGKKTDLIDRVHRCIQKELFKE